LQSRYFVKLFQSKLLRLRLIELIMYSTYEITEFSEFQVSEFTKQGHHIGSITFNKPKFQMSLTKSSPFNKLPDKTITITNGGLPRSMFSQYRDGGGYIYSNGFMVNNNTQHNMGVGFFAALFRLDNVVTGQL
jgi:hypothetical protein